MDRHLPLGLVALLAVIAGVQGQTTTTPPTRQPAAEQPAAANPPAAAPSPSLGAPDPALDPALADGGAADGWGPCCTDPSSCWARVEYLGWWTRGSRLPALVTTSPAGTPREDAGVLRDPRTRVLFGDARVDDELRHGGRILLGLWTDPQRQFAIEGSFFLLREVDTAFVAPSSGEPILARPFFSTLTDLPAADLVAFPGVAFGTVSVFTSSELLGAELYLRENFCAGGSYRLDLLAGYRFLNLRERLQILDALITADPLGPDPPGTFVNRSDRFETDNQFHGFEVGAVAEFRRGRWILELVGKLALGGTHTDLDVDGRTHRRSPELPPENFNGGILALRTNSGHREGTRFAALPEIGINLGYQMTDRLRVAAGYTFFSLSDVARPGDQIDMVINPSQIPPGTLAGARRPTFDGFRDTNIWVQGVNCGVEYRY